jgi:opacity protein-like surface antigen
MKRIAVVGILVMFGSGISFGQLTFGGGASAGVGFSSFQKEISDYFGFGYQFGAHGDMNINKYVTVRLNFDYNIFPSNKDKFIDMVAANAKDEFGNPIAINKADVSISGLNASIFAIGIDGIGKLPTKSAFTPYAIIGFGLHIMSLSDGKVSYKGQEVAQITKPVETQTKFGIRFGAGTEFQLSKLAELYFDVKYVIVFTKESSNGYIPLTFGVTLTP